MEDPTWGTVGASLPLAFVFFEDPCPVSEGFLFVGGAEGEGDGGAKEDVGERERDRRGDELPE